MAPTAFVRAALPVLLAAFGLAAIAWPRARLRRAGVELVVPLREQRRPVVVTFGGLLVAISAIALVYSLAGPGAIGASPATAAQATLGIALFLVGLAVVVAAQRAMGASLRLGIPSEDTALVEGGLYAFVRNPIFTGMLLAFAGVVTMAPAPATALLWLAGAASIAWQVREEERHLLARHGDAYRRYAARVGRFVPGVGRLP